MSDFWLAVLALLTFTVVALGFLALAFRSAERIDPVDLDDLDGVGGGPRG